MNVNLTYVRWLTRAMVVAAIWAWPVAAGASEQPAEVERVTVVLVPNSIGVESLSEAGMAVGLLSAAHGVRPPAQTFLDISQGARISNSLYDEDLPDEVRIRGSSVAERAWAKIVARARSGPGDIVPGLLAATIGPGRVGAEADAELGRLIAVDLSGRIGREGETLRVLGARPAELPAFVGQTGSHHLVIALAVPKVRGQRLVAAGFAGAGYSGVLESRTTRLEGLVSAIDIGPTILERLGREIPGEMDGRVIEADPGGSASDVAELQDRLLELSTRRTPVVWANAAIWVALALAASVALGVRGRSIALPWLAATLAALPATLLIGAALEPSEIAERLLVGLGSPLIAAALLRLAGDYGAFAIAAGISVGAYALDVIAGSPLTALTVGGSNPSSGVRFFGIGNEHEAALAALTVSGTGAALARWTPTVSGRAAALWFTAAAVAAVLAFAPGKFGADVGAAITIPGGAAIAIAVATRAGRRGWALVLAAPFVGLGALVAIDLVSGGDAHFSRTVLDAEDAGDLAQVLSSRLELAWKSVERNASSPFLWGGLAILALAAYYRDRLGAALSAAPRPALAGLTGAAATVVIGTLANDSGLTLFVIGIWFVIPFAGLIWTQRSPDR